MPAKRMATLIKQYLNEPENYFRRFRIKTGNDEYGNTIYGRQWKKRVQQPDGSFRWVNANPKDYPSGQGIYHSSYRNALRYTRTSTNMAYRTSDYERYQRFDFVVGIEVHLSNNHNCKGVPDGDFHDICDELQGRYPKDFKFVGWHPHCRCYVTSILKTPEEMEADEERMDRGEELTTESENEVKDVPQEFKKWVEHNQERAKGWENMPYFIRQNPNYVDNFEVNTYTPQEKRFTRARKTNASMEESLGIYLQREYPDIPNTEIAAIFHYTRGDISAYRQLNKQLRNGELNEFNKAFSQLLSQGLSKLETTQETVYRTMRLNRTGLKEFVENAIEQKEVVFNGFTSASFSKETVLNIANKHEGKKKNETDILLVIKSKNGHPIEKISQFGGRFKGKPNQQEVLFDKCSKFLFNKVDIINGNYVFYLTQI